MDYPKRLIEVDLPIKRISEHSRREKNIRQGHIATLHQWWARRPLAACRAVLCASLWPDPSDAKCPPEFLEQARTVVVRFAAKHLGDCSPESYGRFIKIQRDPDILRNPVAIREALLDFIADFANWDNTTNSGFVQAARDLTLAAGAGLVVDPFCGGGAIPVEAQRIGASVFASDLNPVPVLLNRVVLEMFPQYGTALAKAVEKCGMNVLQRTRKKVGHLYPSGQVGAVPIAYLWARTIVCEGPSCGATVPAMKSLWLAKKSRGSTALKMVPRPRSKRVDFEILENVKASQVGDGTVRRSSVTCPICGYTTPLPSVRRQMKKRHGGAHDSVLVAIREDNPATGQRCYRLPKKSDLQAIEEANRLCNRMENERINGLPLFPDEETPQGGGRGAGRAFSQRHYGMDRFRDLFTPRQLVALGTFAKEIHLAVKDIEDTGLREAVHLCLALALDRLADFNSSLCILNSVGGRGVVHTFGRQALPVVWDFMETNPFNEIGANWQTGIDSFSKTIETEYRKAADATVVQASAANHPLPDESAVCMFTDPPYYDAVPYADLSDFFVAWLKRSLPEATFAELDTGDGVKASECIVDDIKDKDAMFFEATMQNALAEGRRYVVPSGVGVVVFAHKSTSGWEAQLKAMLEAGWVVTGSWPIDTERAGRLRALDSAALGSSVHIVCRPREDTNGNLLTVVGDWRDVLRALPNRIAEWLPRLSAEGVVGADAIFACLGPALEIFSRYSSVEKTSGEKVELREYLEQVWAEVAKQALNMIFEGADTAGLEEDARLTAMWLWTLRTDAEADVEAGEKVERIAGYALEYDAARKIAQGLGCHLENLAHLVEVKGENATLLSAASRARYLFGKEDVNVPKKRGKKAAAQGDLFAALDLLSDEDMDREQAELDRPAAGKTTLDQLHQAMILFGAGRGAALKRFLVDDGVGANPQLWSLAQSLTALYPPQSEEKRWVDGVLARKKGLGF
jgi:putative DNA methylase